MEQTRTSLAEKLEVLEKKVTDTVQEATEAVSETVETVKDTVAETVETVKGSVEDTVGTVKETVSSTMEAVCDTLDLRAQVERYPWTMVGGSLALGFLSGYVLGPISRRTTGAAFGLSTAPEPEPAVTPSFESRTEARQPGLFDQLFRTFGSEIDKLKGLAIGAMGSAVRDMVLESVPENFKPKVNELISNVTNKLGGEMIQGRVLPECQAGEESPSGARTSSYA